MQQRSRINTQRSRARRTCSRRRRSAQWERGTRWQRHRRNQKPRCTFILGGVTDLYRDCIELLDEEVMPLSSAAEEPAVEARKPPPSAATTISNCHHRCNARRAHPMPIERRRTSCAA